MVSPDELRLQVEELRRSRARVVAAADDERRRIERELHDGAQQHLVALAVNIQLARQLADSDPGATKALLEEMRDDVHEALDSVRALAETVYPPLLLDRGLAEGLAAAALKAEIPTRLEIDVSDRYAPEVEAAAYFCCVETVRHLAVLVGTRARATVRVWCEDDALQLEITVDEPNGVPLPPDAGLDGVRDRIGALDGQLVVASEPGCRVLGSIPLRS